MADEMDVYYKTMKGMRVKGDDEEDSKREKKGKREAGKMMDLVKRQQEEGSTNVWAKYSNNDDIKLTPQPKKTKPIPESDSEDSVEVSEDEYDEESEGNLPDNEGEDSEDLEEEDSAGEEEDDDDDDDMQLDGQQRKQSIGFINPLSKTYKEQLD